MSGRVVVVGSVNVDLVVRTARLPGPGETVIGGTFERHHGGKGGNQAVAAARLGRPTTFIGAVGDDAFGEEARTALRAEGVDVDMVMSILGEATGVALILVGAAGENLISVASGANARLTPDDVVSALGRLGSLAGDIVLVSREIPAEVAAEALRAARDAGARTVLNPAPATGIGAEELALADVITPNRPELEAIADALGFSGGAHGGPEELAAWLLPRLATGASVVVTLGGNGAVLVSPGGTPDRYRALPVTPVDSTGAGDAFNGALAVGLAEGRPLAESVRRAVAAAGLSTTVAGAREGMPRLADLERALA